MKVSTVGIVGFGDIARTYLQALKHCPMFRLVAIADTMPVLATDIPDGVRYFKRALDMYRESAIDSVIIATPHSTHAELAIEAVFNRRDVLTEKPIALRRNEFTFVSSTALEQDRLVFGALHAGCGREIEWFVNNHTDFLKKTPPLTHFDVHLCDPYIQNGSLSKKGATLGTPWLDSGVNAHSILRNILPLLSVSDLALKSVGGVGEDFEFDTLATYSFTTPWNKKGQGSIRCSWNQHSSQKYTRLVFADGSCVILNHEEEAVQMLDPEGIEVSYQSLKNDRPRLVNHYVRVLNDFATALQTRISNLETYRGINTHFFAVLDEIENCRKVAM